MPGLSESIDREIFLQTSWTKTWFVPGLDVSRAHPTLPGGGQG